jgi:hypothetical protein
MKETILHVRVKDEVLIPFKIFCIKNKVSIPKQVEQILSSFLEIQNQNEKIMELAKKG